jgi:hypothetical protein
MTGIRLHRGVAGTGTGLGVRQVVQGNTTNGRQDKSADLSRAHVVGCVGFFEHCKIATCWRFAQISNNFNDPGAVAPPQEGRAAHDDRRR